jgi:hypothetical protein
MNFIKIYIILATFYVGNFYIRAQNNLKAASDLNKSMTTVLVGCQKERFRRLCERFLEKRPSDLEIVKAKKKKSVKEKDKTSFNNKLYNLMTPVWRRQRGRLGISLPTF